MKRSLKISVLHDSHCSQFKWIKILSYVTFRECTVEIKCNICRAAMGINQVWCIWWLGRKLRFNAP
jgi:hypothetical protein